MRRSLASVATVAAACCSAYASPSPFHPPHTLSRRNVVDASGLQSSYDFIVVGGGVAGMVLASRLSEDQNHTVLVLEAGDTGELVQDIINTPGDTYYDGLLGSSYDWQFTTVAQPNANGRSLSWPRGKVLGGSSAVNGMYAVRANALEYNTWSSLQNGASGAEAWNWTNQLSMMQKSETFTAPSSDLAAANDLLYNASSHGSSGPLHVSWPGFILPTVGNWSSTLETAGIPMNSDPYGGDNTGGFVSLSTINPNNWTRSYARAAYLDPLPPRSNLAVLPNATVTRIYFSTGSDGNITATNVEWATSASAARANITVNKEVILSGGTIGSPNVLMQSGVGPSDVLKAAGVDQVLNLPGVGQHLFDHLSLGVAWSTDSATIASMRDAGDTDPAFLASINEAEAYVNLTTLLGSSQAQTYIENVTSSMSTYASTLCPSSDSTVCAGYQAIYGAIANTFMPSLGHVEILLSTQGQKGSSSQSVQVQAALQHPLSQGRLYISSSDPFSAPTIDPSYLTHPFDIIALREALKLARTIGDTAPLSQYLLSETSPGSSVSTDADWDTFVAQNAGTEYHPAGSCAMLPLSNGGVVGVDLKVHGATNVRVVDSSVIPVPLAAHLMLPTYAIAETGAEIVKAAYGGAQPAWAASDASGASGTSSADGSSQTGGSESDHSSGAGRSVSVTSGVSVILAGICVAFSLL